MSEKAYGRGEGPAIRTRVGKREFSAFVAAAVERESRGQVLDAYLADYERRKGPVSESARRWAQQVCDGILAEEDRSARTSGSPRTSGGPPPCGSSTR
ncbi:hypothetical protein ABZ990_08120 [Streptomyces sp. NPDC046203]|uniref:hypothetical protein n=1 Tax=Streptomyces sp. NPDC046203 TaxID=3154602 RepID=UPI0033F307A8